MVIRASLPLGTWPDAREDSYVNWNRTVFRRPHKGYGFIKPDGGGADVLVDICAVERAGMASLDQGQRLSFEVVRDERVARSFVRRESWRFWIAGPPLNARRNGASHRASRRSVARASNAGIGLETQA
jgi:cold shock protein